MRKHIERRVIALALVGVLTMGALTGCGKKKNSATKAFDYDITDYVTVGAYTGLDVTEEITTVTDEDVQEEIDTLVSNATTYEEVTDRAIQADDRITVNYTRGVSGSDEDAESEDSKVIELGSGEMSTQFEENVIGLSVGDSKAFTVDEEVTEDTTDEDGNATTNTTTESVMYSVEVITIEQKVVPEVTDEFIAEQTENEYTTLADYKTGKKAELEEDAASTAKSSTETDLLNMIIDSSDIKGCPAFIYNMAYNNIYQNYALYASYFGSTTEDYMEQCGVEDSDIRKQAVQSATETLVIEAICKAADIDITDEQYETNLETYVSENSSINSKEELLEQYSKSELLADMRRDAAIEYIYENNNVTQTYVEG